VPGKTIIEIAGEEQAEILRELRAVRYGYLLGIQIVLLSSEGHSPTEIARFLFCSRTSVYRAVEEYKSGKLRIGKGEEVAGQSALRMYIPKLKRSLLALIKRAPEAYGWCRTRWSCATLSLELKARRGVSVSAETVRCWLHEQGYVWKRARHVAKDDDPERARKLGRIRSVFEQLGASEVLLFADELDIHLLPKIGYQWMLKGTQTEVMTPGSNEKRYLAGALDIVTGKILHTVGCSKSRYLFIELLNRIERTYKKFDRIYMVVDNYRIHRSKDVEKWLGVHPRFELLWLPTYCPRANPIERAFGDVHDKCTRNHQRKRIDDLVDDIKWHLKKNGPWRYKLSDIYYDREIENEVKKLKNRTKLIAA
jgi:transposase